MSDERHRVCITRDTPGSPTWNTHVYTQVLGPDGEWGPWRHRITRSVYVDPMVYDDNRALRKLLTSLKC
jgi:hypothetical protein